VQCSGGQRARIGLARALYRDADVLLLDDPLSAVDSRVGRRIFLEGVMELAVGRGRCVVLATHQHQFIGESRCVLMSDGKIKTIASFADCVAASDGKLHRVSYNTDVNDSTEDPHPDDTSTTPAPDRLILEEEVDTDSADDEPPQNASSGDKDATPVTSKGVGNGNDSDNEDNQEEVKVEGVVRRKTFLMYARATGSIPVVSALLVLFALTQLASLLSIVYIGRFSELTKEDQMKSNFTLIVLLLAASVTTLSVLRAQTCFALTVRASKRLHDAMSLGLLRAKIQFFDTNPSGRILNRFSADVGSNDDLLPNTLFDCLVCSFVVLGALATAVAALPLVLAILPPLLCYFVRIRRIFVTSSRELKRLDGVARSPVFAVIGEGMSGAATLRVNGCGGFLRERFEERHDAHTRAFFAFLASSRWLGFRMDAIMFVITACATFLAVLAKERGAWVRMPLFCSNQHYITSHRPYLTLHQLSSLLPLSHSRLVHRRPSPPRSSPQHARTARRPLPMDRAHQRRGRQPDGRGGAGGRVRIAAVRGAVGESPGRCRGRGLAAVGYDRGEGFRCEVSEGVADGAQGCLVRD